MNNATASVISKAEANQVSVFGYPPTIVLQPNGDLTKLSSQTFQQSLEEALDLARESVIVDLLWVKETDGYGIASLIAGLEKASQLGKTISFQAMNARTRVALEIEWNRQRDIQLGSWNILLKDDLERFLDSVSR